MNVLSRFKQRLLLKCFVKGNGILDAAEFIECDPETVLRYLKRFGIALWAAHDRLVTGLSVERIEADEVWSFVYGKSRNRKRFKPGAPKGAGDIFTWTALDPDSKLIAAWHVSPRTRTNALRFMTDLRSRLVSKVMITTDALSLYKNAIANAFGSDADHVIIHKVLKSRWDRETGDKHVVVVEMTKEVQHGALVDVSAASTSHNERHNGTMRNAIGRLQRYSYGFSKKRESHVWAQAIYFFWYNFRKAHRSLRHTTPAMEAGIADRVWEWDDFLDETDRYWRELEERTPPPTPTLNGIALVPIDRDVARPDCEFFVCEDTKVGKAKVHMGHCRNCRWGLGRGGKGVFNKWYAFPDRVTAEAAAAVLAPDGNGTCSMCIKRKYRTRSQPT
ncbi:MAG TPA: hypothetical protein VGL66_19280 [Caulobacteraceae bacterium]